MYAPSQYKYNIYVLCPPPRISLYSCSSSANLTICLSNFEFGKHVVIYCVSIPRHTNILFRPRPLLYIDMEREWIWYSRQVYIASQPPVAAQNPTDNHPRIIHLLNHLHLHTHIHTHTYIHTEISLETSQGFTM